MIREKLESIADTCETETERFLAIEGLIADAKICRDCVEILADPGQFCLELKETVILISMGIEKGYRLAESSKDAIEIYSIISRFDYPNEESSTEIRLFEDLTISGILRNDKVNFRWKEELRELAGKEGLRAKEAARDLMFLVMAMEGYRLEHEDLSSDDPIKVIADTICQEH